ncbi:putative porin [Paraburkholderia youngii]
MKLKTSSAIVLAIFATAAHAQSSVTLYGVIDTGFLYQSTSAATFLPHAPNTGKIYQLKDGGIYCELLGFERQRRHRRRL